jgi:hypothetical protein
MSSTVFLVVKGPGESLVYGDGVTTSSEYYVLPSKFRGGKVVIQAEGAHVWFVLGTSASVVASSTTMSSVTSNVMTPDATTGGYIPDGTALEFVVPSKYTHFAVVGSDTGRFRMWESDINTID